MCTIVVLIFKFCPNLSSGVLSHFRLWVLLLFEVFSFVTIWFSGFVTVWVFEFCHNWYFSDFFHGLIFKVSLWFEFFFSFVANLFKSFFWIWVLWQFQRLSFVTIYFCSWCHNLNFLVVLLFCFSFNFFTIWVFEFCCNLSSVLSQF